MAETVRLTVEWWLTQWALNYLRPLGRLSLAESDALNEPVNWPVDQYNRLMQRVDVDFAPDPPVRKEVLEVALYMYDRMDKVREARERRG